MATGQGPESDALDLIGRKAPTPRKEERLSAFQEARKTRRKSPGSFAKKPMGYNGTALGPVFR